MTELAIIGSDIQEVHVYACSFVSQPQRIKSSAPILYSSSVQVVGSAIALKILFRIPLWAGCAITGLDTFTFLGLHFFGVHILLQVL
jgi:hypothetical protein